MSTSVAFTGWNSALRAWNTSTWNTSAAYPVTATASVNSDTVAVTGAANVSVTGVAGTSVVDAVTVVGLANVSVTGVAGTSALGSVSTTRGDKAFVTGVSGTGLVTAVADFPVIWGQIIPSQTSNFSAISPSQTPSWTDVAA